MRQAGFTVLEVLVTSVLIAILVTVGAPALAEMITAQQRLDTAQQLASGIRTARTEAVLRNKLVVIRAIDRDWSKGWQILVDPKGNADDLVLVDRARSAKVPVVGNAHIKASIGFDGLGAAVGNGFVAGTLSICDADEPLSHYQVILARTGRVRIENIRKAEKLCAS